MTRTLGIIAIAAVAIGLLAGGGVVLLSAAEDRAATSTSTTSTSTLPREGGPELESSAVGELPDAEAATRRFLAGYLPLIYAKRGASIDALHNASPLLLRRLHRESSRVPPAQAALTPRLQRVTVLGQSRLTAMATALIKDSAAPAWPLVLYVQKDGDAWVVTRIGGP